MKKIFCLATFILAGIFLQQAALAQKPVPTKFTEEQVKEIQNITHGYIVNNPQVLVEASKNLQEKEHLKEKARVEEIKAAIPKYKDLLFNTKAPGRVVLGNPKGEIIVAEFTQHQCPSCRLAKPIIKKLLKENPDLQLIVIYWPFFGNDAIYSSKAAIAAHKQGKFEELNSAILKPDSFVHKAKIDEIIKSTPSIDSKKLYADMSNKDLDAGIKSNFDLAQKLNLIGTPAFIFTNKEMTKFSLVPGQTGQFEADLNKALKEVR